MAWQANPRWQAQWRSSAPDSDWLLMDVANWLSPTNSQGRGAPSIPLQSLPEELAADAFYDDPDCQRMFRAFLRAMALRVNSLTGVAYR